jgi:NADH-quinone oxidoreductase subunit L
LVNLTAWVSGAFGLLFRKTQTGRVQTYVVLALFSVMIFYFIFRLG